MRAFWSTSVGLSLFLFATLSGQRSVRADELTTVTLGDSGPDRSIPVGKSFYLASNVPESVVFVRPVVVRVQTSIIVPHHAESCEDALEYLKLPTKKKLEEAPVGRTKSASLWAGEEPIYVGPAWKRGDLKDKQDVKLLIEGEDKFFETGAQYCLYQFHITRKVDVDNQFEKRARDCAQYTGAALTKCVEKVIADAPTESRTALETALTNAQSALVHRRNAGPAILAILEAFGGPGKNVVTPEQFPPVLERKLPFPRALLALLVGHNALRPQVETLEAKDKKLVRVIEQYTLDASVKVNGVGLSMDDKKIVVYESPTSAKGAQKDLSPVTTEQLLLPDSTISLYELLRWTRGEVKFGNAYVSASDLATSWAKLSKADYVPSAQEVKDLKAVSARMHQLSDAIRRAFQAYNESKNPAGGADIVYAALGEWLTGVDDDHRRVAGCNPLTSQPFAPQVTAAKLCGKGVGWPGYAPDHDGGPVGELYTRIDELVNALDVLAANPLTVRKAVENVTVVQTLRYQILFTQKSWIFTYVTPTVGYASITKDGGTVGYLAVQIHLFPNELDEPQWVNGRDDWRRAFALELGAGFGGKFGPDDRYDGPGDLPILFAGLAFHPLAYTSISGGVAIFDRRSSLISGEAPKLDAALYLGANVQINVPALIGGMFATPSSTSTN